MPQLRVQIQDLQNGDKLVPSGREVLDVTIGPNTPNGFREIHLKNSNDDGTQRYSFEGSTVVTVQRD